MDKSEKLAKIKQVVVYLTEKFPNCFIAQGEAKPLKIGIFQDLAERLKDESELSKTTLRAALRQYTSSWRYLHGLKAGAERVDLDGNPCGVLTEEHVEHAQAALKESKDRAYARKRKNADAEKGDKPKKRPQGARNKATPRPAKKVVPKKPVDPSTLSVNQGVQVLVGKSPVPATIKEIQKDELLVQLNSGMVVKVNSQHVIL
ncbi:RNA chaperone ProQ [Dongshaea marina]|uniref:RNA chaperone ProQ n=1 Tax=Dongshaea marina TaxID=2047966 RepID=UPI000D3E3C7C|nr:RNA chaperone ProQ [Dongshaea marina]